MDDTAGCSVGADNVLGPRIHESCRAFDFTLLFEDGIFITLPAIAFPPAPTWTALFTDSQVQEVNIIEAGILQAGIPQALVRFIPCITNQLELGSPLTAILASSRLPRISCAKFCFANEFESHLRFARCDSSIECWSFIYSRRPAVHLPFKSTCRLSLWFGAVGIATTTNFVAHFLGNGTTGTVDGSLYFDRCVCYY
ncbi:hypothetical protein J3458_013250 [Metarhizium acridum]|uniref:uncharacterized protein n=1 Tax=Metarhizium acridum TaxID=92637 RepID=UPI001C6C303F|nr:hypothetical protein J3458_013250 [Metarhizium acridum]